MNENESPNSTNQQVNNGDNHTPFMPSQLDSKQSPQVDQDNNLSSMNFSSGSPLPDFSLASNADYSKFDLPDVDYNISPLSPAAKPPQRLVNPIMRGASSGNLNINTSGNSQDLESVSNLDLTSFASIGDNLSILPTPNLLNENLLDSTVTPSEIPDSFIIDGGNVDNHNTSILASPVIYNADQIASQIPLNSEGLPIRTCEICRQPVESDGLFTNGLYYHRTCAKCFKCGCQIEPPNCSFICDILVCPNCATKSSIFNSNKSLQSASFSSLPQISLNQNIDQNDSSLPKCSVCSEVINGTKSIINLENGMILHTNCLSCFECTKILMKGHQKVLDGKVFCRRCYSVASERVCQICNKIIIGPFVKAHKKYYHFNHFTCSVCKKVLNGKNYVIHHNKLYCPSHGKYFSDHCAFCKRALYLSDEEKIRFNGKIYHTICFVCRVCGTSLRPETAKLFHCRPHCMDCYQRRLHESSSGIDKQHKHNPEISVQRRIRYMNEGIHIIIPQYEDRDKRFFENVIPIKNEEKDETRPGLINLSSLEFEDL